MNLKSADAKGLYSNLASLFSRQKAIGMDSYLADHGRAETIKQHVNSFCWYAPFLPETGDFLDWGCNYGPDSCLLRQTFGEGIRIQSCDFYDETSFPVFREFARSTYQPLTQAVELPYPDNCFDVVIGSGVLEHVAHDYESLKEVYRVLKPEGVLVITYLPYYRSWYEWYLRCIKKRAFHRRLYSRSELSQLLKRTGLYPLAIEFHTFVPNMVDATPWAKVKAIASRALSPLFRHTTLCAVAKKVSIM